MARFRKERRTQLNCFQQVTEVHPCRGILYQFAAQVDLAELQEHRNFVQRILTGHLTQVERCSTSAAFVQDPPAEE